MRHNSVSQPSKGSSECSLRDGRLVAPLTEQSGDASDQPRSLRTLARIIDGDLCHRCGTCVGICPTGVLGLDADDYPSVVKISACTDCDLCVRVCPGDRLDFDNIHRTVVGRQSDIAATHGVFLRAGVAHTTEAELRRAATSGGVVTQLLLSLKECNLIDGAIVIGSDRDLLWRGRALLARTSEEIRAAAKSKYAIAPTNAVLSELRRYEGRYAVVGLPCQIHGVLKACSLDKRIARRIALTIGLFCHAAVEHEAFRVLWQHLGSRVEDAVQFVSRIGKHPGTPHLIYRDGRSQPVYFPGKKHFRPSSMEMLNVIYRLYTPSRCMTCFDGLAELADIAVGDPWMAPPADDINFYQGWSFFLLRNGRGEEAFDSAMAQGKIHVRWLKDSDAYACNRHMAGEKRRRAFLMLKRREKLGKPIPDYGFQSGALPGLNGSAMLKAQLNLLTHLFCFMPACRAAVFKFFLGRGGYMLLWLNNKRRSLKFRLRDLIARLRRAAVKKISAPHA